MPLNASVFEVVVVRPDREIQPQCKGEYVDIIGITRADAARGLSQLPFVLGALHNGDWKGRQGQQKRVQLEALLPGEGSEVLEDFIVGDCRRGHLFDLLVPKYQGRASADDG